MAYGGPKRAQPIPMLKTLQGAVSGPSYAAQRYSNTGWKGRASGGRINNDRTDATLADR